jgi:hypothetical protein
VANNPARKSGEIKPAGKHSGRANKKREDNRYYRIKSGVIEEGSRILKPRGN